MKGWSRCSVTTRWYIFERLLRNPSEISKTIFRRMDKNSGRKQPFCFVTFKDDQVATKLVKQHWFDVMGKRCEIKTAVENKEKKIANGTWGKGPYSQNNGYGGYGQHGGGFGNGNFGGGGGAWGAGSGPAGE